MFHAVFATNGFKLKACFWRYLKVLQVFNQWWAILTKTLGPLTTNTLKNLSSANAKPVSWRWLRQSAHLHLLSGGTDTNLLSAYWFNLKVGGIQTGSLHFSKSNHIFYKSYLKLVKKQILSIPYFVLSYFCICYLNIVKYYFIHCWCS